MQQWNTLQFSFPSHSPFVDFRSLLSLLRMFLECFVYWIPNSSILNSLPFPSPFSVTERLSHLAHSIPIQISCLIVVVVVPGTTATAENSSKHDVIELWFTYLAFSIVQIICVFFLSFPLSHYILLCFDSLHSSTIYSDSTFPIRMNPENSGDFRSFDWHRHREGERENQNHITLTYSFDFKAHRNKNPFSKKKTRNEERERERKEIQDWTLTEYKE